MTLDPFPFSWCVPETICEKTTLLQFVEVVYSPLPSVGRLHVRAAKDHKVASLKLELPP
jgi:hypothetical protein